MPAFHELAVPMNPLALILALVAAAWGVLLLVRGGLMAGCLLVLLSGACFGHPFWNVPVQPVPITLDRLLLGVLVGQFVVYRSLGRTRPATWTPGDWALLALVGTLTLSTFTHDWTIDQKQPAATLVFFYYMPLVLYLVARRMILSTTALRWVLGSLAAFGVYLAVVAWAEVHEHWGVVFPTYIASPKHAEYFGRGRGPFLNPTANGLYLSAGLAATLLLWMRANSRLRLVLLAAAAAIAAGLYYTLTRSVWMGAALVVLIAVAPGLPRAWRLLTVGGTLLAALLVLAFHWESFLAFKRDKELTAEDVADSAALRPVLAAVAWEMFRDRPLAGFGFGQYKREHVAYLASRRYGIDLEKARGYIQHNQFLGLLVETGLLGAGLCVLVLALWGRQAWRVWCRSDLPLEVRQMGLLLLAVLAAYVVNAMFHDVSLVPGTNALLFFLAATTESLATSRRATGALPEQPARPERPERTDAR
jgi:O-antigen ligase